MKRRSLIRWYSLKREAEHDVRTAVYSHYDNVLIKKRDKVWGVYGVPRLTSQPHTSK